MIKKYYFLILLSLITLSACSTYNTKSIKESKNSEWIVPPFVENSYSAVENENYYLPPIDMHTIQPKYWRQNVYYPNSHEPGTLLVDTDNRFLYYVVNQEEAIRYGIGVGKDGLALKGNVVVAQKKEWPHWTPTSFMMKRNPERYAHLGKGLEPGSKNPLGARALYLHRGGKDTHFRIHGSSESWSIGKAVSSGCIRMLNQDVIDLYDRVNVGAKVIVL